MLVYFIKGTMDELRDEVQTSHSTIQMTTKTGRHTLNIVENTSGWSTASINHQKLTGIFNPYFTGCDVYWFYHSKVKLQTE